MPALDPAPAQLTGNRLLGQQLAAQRGWKGRQWSCLLTLWNHESQWNHLAQNPTSTAFGIGQFLDATWAGYGAKTSDPTRQIRYGMAYVADRYGAPCSAWSAWSRRSPHWY